MTQTIQSAAHRGRFNAEAAGSRLLWSRHQIIDLFDRFIHEDRAVSVHYAEEERLIVTRAAHVDPNLDRIYFEYGDHKAANAQLLRSKEVQFSVEDGGRQAQFSSQSVRDVLLNGKPVFHISIPERVIQADRRLHQRIEVPQVSAPTVIFNLPNGRIARGQLADLSAGGIGVIGLAADLKVRDGTVIRHCLIQLVDGKRVLVDLEIRHSGVLMGNDGKLMQRVGFRLVSRPKEFAGLLDAFTVDF
ncbi:MAG: flagellar brake protein [Burkholderiales bacterium]|jgi:c-di-GMP-binding flagellar brake protein YcgR